MEELRIIIIIGICVGILLYKKTKPNFLKGVLVALLLSLILPFSEINALINIAFVSFGVLSFIYSIYSVLHKNWLNLVIGLAAFVSFFFKIQHYPYTSLIQLLMVIPIACYFLRFVKKKRMIKELSIVTLFVAYEISEFIRFFIV